MRLAVWAHDINKSSTTFHSSRLEPESGWTSPENFYQGSVRIVEETVRIAGNAAGDAMVLWAEKYNDQSDIFACCYSADEGWEEPILIGNALEHLGLEIVVDALGNAFAVWMTTSTSAHCPSGKCGIWTNRYQVGQGWQTAQRIHDGWTFDDDKDLSVTIDSDGNVMTSNGNSKNIKSISIPDEFTIHLPVNFPLKSQTRSRSNMPS